MKPGDLNLFYTQLAQTPEMQAAAAAVRKAAPAAPLPQPISKAEARAVGLAANIAKGGTRIFAEGDSWFDFPNWILLDPVSDVLDGLIHEHGYVVTRISRAGDTVANMSRSQNLQLIRQNLAALRPEAFLFSGGGNDLCDRRQNGTNEFYDVLFGPPAPHGLQTKLLSTYLDRIMAGYELVLAEAVAAKVPAFVHSYAHAIATGIPAVYKFAGPWLKPQLVAKAYDAKKEGPAIVAQMIDALSDRLAQLAQESHGKIYFVDLRGVIQANDWHDELHLLPRGWRKAAKEFNKAIRSVLGH